MIETLRRWGERALIAMMSAAILAMMLLTAADVVARYLLNAPISGSYEISQFLLAIAIFASLPLVCADQGHICVSLFEDKFKGAAFKAQQLVIQLGSLFAIGFLSWRLWELAGLMSHGGRVTGALEWPIAPLVYVMAAFAALATLVTAVSAWAAIAGGRNRTARSAAK